jgi:hypothetical protein
VEDASLTHTNISFISEFVTALLGFLSSSVHLADWCACNILCMDAFRLNQTGKLSVREIYHDHGLDDYDHEHDDYDHQAKWQKAHS